VASKNQKELMKDLKLVYKADTKELSELKLEELADKWEQKYPVVINSSKNNWHKLSTFFDYSPEIRRLVYTTNPIKAFLRQLRKVTKTKRAFPTNMALLKLVYLATKRIEQKWTSPLHNWSLTVQQLAIKFRERMTLDLTGSHRGLAPDG
jgi:putative transposase